MIWLCYTVFMKRSGFTLIELMVVVGIIGLLSALAVVSLSRQQARSRDARRVGDIDNINTALQSWIDDRKQPPYTGSYPATDGTTYNAIDSGQWDVSSMPTSAPTFMKFLSDFGYMSKVPLDPINNATSETPYSYIYHYYTTDAGTFGYKNGWKAYVLIAYLETDGLKHPMPTRNNGPLFGDTAPYAYVIHEAVVPGN